jgi:hypothetical protein
LLCADGGRVAGWVTSMQTLCASERDLRGVCAESTVCWRSRRSSTRRISPTRPRSFLLSVVSPLRPRETCKPSSLARDHAHPRTSLHRSLAAGVICAGTRVAVDTTLLLLASGWGALFLLHQPAMPCWDRRNAHTIALHRSSAGTMPWPPPTEHGMLHDSGARHGRPRAATSIAGIVCCVRHPAIAKPQLTRPCHGRAVPAPPRPLAHPAPSSSVESRSPARPEGPVPLLLRGPGSRRPCPPQLPAPMHTCHS